MQMALGYTACFHNDNTCFSEQRRFLGESGKEEEVLRLAVILNFERIKRIQEPDVHLLPKNHRSGPGALSPCLTHARKQSLRPRRLRAVPPKGRGLTTGHVVWGPENEGAVSQSWTPTTMGWTKPKTIWDHQGWGSGLWGKESPQVLFLSETMPLTRSHIWSLSPPAGIRLGASTLAP